MANHQIVIKENSTKTLATAGKYCDRNIDVVVDVSSSGGATPTQFTNILDLDTTIVKEGYRAVTSKYSETSDGVVVVTPVKAGTHEIRVRGKWVYWHLSVSTSTSLSNLRTGVYFSTTTPTSEEHGGSSLYGHSLPTLNESATISNGGQFSIDEYGDWYMTVTVSQDGYLAFTLKDMSKVFANCGSFACEPIITIDEPIGNGGVV